MASDDALIYRESQSLGLAVPPVHVLRELFRTWSWLKVQQKSRFSAGPGFDSTGVLSEAEQIAMQVIEQYDGVACRFELRDAIEQKLNHSDMAVSVMLGSSPIFQRLEHGIYLLIGRRVGDAAVNAARTRMRVMSSANGAPAFPEAKANEFMFRVTGAALKNEQYGVPSRFHGQLAGQRMPFEGPTGVPRGEARISQSGALSGFNRLFTPKIGDVFRVVVGTDGLRVELLRSEQPPSPVHSAGNRT